MAGTRIDIFGGITGFDQFVAAVGSELSKNNGLDITKHYRTGKDTASLFNIQDAVFWKKPPKEFRKDDTLCYLRDLEKKYGLNLNHLVSLNTERIDACPGEDHILWNLHYKACQFEDYLDRECPNFLLMSQPSKFDQTLLLLMAVRKGIETRVYKVARVKSHLFFSENTIEDKCIRMIKNYESVKDGDYDQKELNNAKKFLDSYNENPRMALYYKKVKIKGFAQKFTNLFLKFPQIVSNPNWYNGLKKGFISNITEKNYLFSGVFDMPVEGEDYFLYPLHVHPEVATLLLGRWNSLQIQLIKNIAFSLPVGMKLYVKEHKYFGMRQKYIYDELKKVSNIRIISPYADMVQLIRKSIALVTLNSTAGLEAVFLKKPVIICGSSMYDFPNSVKKVRCMDSLRSTINDVLSKNSDDVKDDRIRFTMAFLRSVYPGNCLEPSMCEGESLEPANIKKIAEAILQEIGYVEKKKKYAFTNEIFSSKFV
jgi:hypothetical protein